MLVDLYTKDGKVSGQIELQDDIFGIEPNEHAMHQAVVAYLAHQRQGTHKTKLRSEVSGGGKKPWRQKGRGTARSGSSRSPVWVGGGTVHGPKPHTYSYKLPKRVSRLARMSAFALRLSEANLVVVEDFTMPVIKTKQMAEILKNLKVDSKKTLLLTTSTDNNVYLSGRNIPNFTIQAIDKISTYDILKHKKVVLFKGAVSNIENTFNN